jgi:hypothetical protein
MDWGGWPYFLPGAAQRQLSGLSLGVESMSHFSFMAWHPVSDTI